jgi:hypothetical protein
MADSIFDQMSNDETLEQIAELAQIVVIINVTITDN